MSQKPHILIVEDELDIAQILKMQLQSKGFDVSVIHDGLEALEYIQSQEQSGQGKPVDLFILDRMLPRKNGIEICQFLRIYKKTKHAPILMITALANPDHVVEGLDAGADDYITKPFDLNVVLARVRSLLRRSEILNHQKNAQEQDILEIRDLKIDTNQCKAWISDGELDLTLSEYKLLCCFMKEPGKVMTRNQLVEFIQDGPVHVTDRTIDTHIFGLRKKLGEHASLIETIRGIGYRVVNE